jgi:hypothetical protein
MSRSTHRKKQRRRRERLKLRNLVPVQRWDLTTHAQAIRAIAQDLPTNHQPRI